MTVVSIWPILTSLARHCVISNISDLLNNEIHRTRLESYFINCWLLRSDMNNGTDARTQAAKVLMYCGFSRLTYLISLKSTAHSGNNMVKLPVSWKSTLKPRIYGYLWKYWLLSVPKFKSTPNSCPQEIFNCLSVTTRPAKIAVRLPSTS